MIRSLAGTNKRPSLTTAPVIAVVTIDHVARTGSPNQSKSILPHFQRVAAGRRIGGVGVLVRPSPARPAVLGAESARRGRRGLRASMAVSRTVFSPALAASHHGM